MSVADTLHLLAGPLAFLLAAALLAALLEEVGLFAALADRITTGPRVAGGLWVLGTVTVALVNLDAAVVLLTPLTIRIARRAGIPVLPFAASPALVALLASSFLPVSNLTTLIVVQADPTLRTGDLLAHLGLPSLVAVGVGWLAFRRLLPRTDAAPVDLIHDAVEPDALRRGLIVLGPTVIAFLVLPAVGLEPWPAAVAADLVLVAMVRRLPWRAVPWYLAVAVPLASLAAVRVAELLALDELRLGSDAGTTVAVGVVGAAAANLVNNLPALLGGLVAVPADGPARWALLLGVNAGAGFLLWGSLSTVLWRSILRRHGEEVTARGFALLGLQVVLPAFAAALVTLAVRG